MNGADSIVTGLVLVLGAVAVWRWPAQLLIVTVGLPVAAIVWTAVGPWAGWSVFGLVAMAVVAWSLCDGDERVGLPAARALLARPAVCVGLVFLGAIAVLLSAATDRLAVTALLVAVVAGGWLVFHPWRPAPRVVPSRHPARRANVRDAGGRGAGESVGNAQHVTATGECPCCGWVMVATVQVPAAGPIPDTVVAWAICTRCGARSVGIVDPARGNQVVWLDVPPPAGDGPMQGVA